jgi:hypothetical protein
MAENLDLLLSLFSGEMSSNPKFTMSSLLQNIIYFFNQTKIRNYVIEHFIEMYHVKEKVVWDGTYYFNEEGKMDNYYHPELKEKSTTLTEFIKSRKPFHEKNKKKFIIFTACILYEENKVHYLAFVYDTQRQLLVCFDPGIRLYHKGQDILVPLLAKTFKECRLIPTLKNIERVGLCSKKFYGQQWGIQYEGSNPKQTNLPADSFCQLWTICFLVEFIKNRCSDTFLSHWCTVPPKIRESFALTYANQFFTLPYVYKQFRIFYPSGDLNRITPFIIQNVSKPQQQIPNSI